MKKLISTLLALLLCIINLTGCSAETLSTNEETTVIIQIDNPVMTINGTETSIDKNGTVPIVRNDRTLIPIRAVIEAFGGNVEWKESTREVTLTMGSSTIRLMIGNQTAYLNDSVYTLDVAPAIINERTMLPIRFVAEGFGLDVDWNENDRIITITKNNAYDKALTSTEIQKENDGMINLNISVNGRQFRAKLYDNEAANAWIKQLPVTYNMDELNGNEKYYFLDGNLPADSNRPNIINAGDIMLYGSNCIVLFYETFSTSYSYTPLGYMENPTGLADALGRENVKVTFEIQ